MQINKIPLVRFPNFKEEWEVKKLGEIGSIKGGGTPTSNVSKYWIGNIPWISSSDILDNNIQDIKISRFINEDAVSNSATKIIEKGTVLIVSRVGVGKFAVSKEPICTSQDFSNFKPKIDNPYFLAYYFLAKRKKFLSLAQGTSIKGFTGKDIRNLKFVIPNSLTEQQKIAHFFTILDQKLSQLQEKRTHLETYKKGMMQKIFAVGEKSITNTSITNDELDNTRNSSFVIPNYIRFKDENGKNYPDWEVKKLGEVGMALIGLTYSPKDVVNSGGTLVLRSSNVQNKRLAFEDNVYVKGYISEKNFVKENDILICARNGSRSLIGKSALITKEYENCAFGAFMAVYRCEFNLFFFHVFQTDIFDKQITQHLGATINQITNKSLLSFKFPIPCNEEQTKIANFLSKIDKKINNVNQQIEKTKTYKKGLLQRMFV